MGRETNIHLILALEKQIEESKGDVIKLKRARNSLLNISTRVPPEILGEIFVWRLLRDPNRSPHSWQFDGLQKGCYNFLLVCHHWFEVASRTTEIWSFWGNTFQDWKKRHHRSGASPIDLVLDGNKCDPGVIFDGPLQLVVRSRFVQDSIRRVHIRSDYSDTLASVVWSLTPHNEGPRNENIESIIWWGGGFRSVDVSDFFARSRLSKLRFLDLTGSFRISSWDSLASHTTLLTTLSLGAGEFPTPLAITTSQLLRILASNPNLQELKLFDAVLPSDTDGPAFQVPLHDLKLLSVLGEFRLIFGLLRQLILPEILDNISLIGSDSTVEEVSQTLVPYMQDYFRRDTRFQDRLEVSSLSSPGRVSISVNIVCAQTTEPTRKPPSATFTVVLADPLPSDARERLFIDLIALTPRENVVSFYANLNMKPLEGLFFAMPNVEMLRLSEVDLSKGFLQPNLDGPRFNTKLFPSLRSLHLENVKLDENDWGHLTSYLVHQTSDGQIVSLEVLGKFPYMPPEVVNEIKGLVRGFVCDQDPEMEDGEPPFSCGCLTPEEDDW